MKTILVTGATDGIGLETTKILLSMGYRVLLHGRNPDKIEMARQSLTEITRQINLETYLADLSSLSNVRALAFQVIERHAHLDAIINNAGILTSSKPITSEGFDVRFAVNTFAPYLLTRHLLPLLDRNGRVINVSSAGQLPVDLEALAGRTRITDDYLAYAQSKLALNMWSRHIALETGDQGPAIIAVNPGSLLASKMVKEAFGIDGADIRIGANILVRAACSGEFVDATGLYYDNDAQKFAPPHEDALDDGKSLAVVQAIEKILSPFR